MIENKQQYDVIKEDIGNLERGLRIAIEEGYSNDEEKRSYELEIEAVESILAELKTEINEYENEVKNRDRKSTTICYH